MSSSSPIILAIDTKDLAKAASLLELTSPFISTFKIGLEFFLTHGKSGVKYLQQRSPNLDLFLDLKLHDIPNTVKGACEAVAELSPRLLTVHSSGGAEMVRVAAQALPSTLVTAVTVLTSLDSHSLEQMGLPAEINDLSGALAVAAQNAGAKAFVSSPLELPVLRGKLGGSAVLVTPGVRPSSHSKDDDQKRTMTPKQAIASGADFIVVGRPITSAENPALAAREILQSLS